jgi:hypothetical protein
MRQRAAEQPETFARGGIAVAVAAIILGPYKKPERLRVRVHST